MMDTNKYVPIDYFSLKKGLKLDCGIYYKSGSSFVLLYKNITVDNKFLSDIMPFYTIHGGLYLNKNDYGQLNQVIESEIDDENSNLFDENFKKKFVKVKNIYSNILDITQNFIQDISEKDTIDNETVNTLVDELSSTIIEKNNDEVIFHCINEIKATDAYLYNHSVNVGTLNGLMGLWLGLDDVQNKKLVKIGLMHDMGKLRVPQDVLNKPGKLTPEEFEIIKMHPVYSYDMLVETGENDKEILDGVKHHHEKETGAGYPSHLSSENIPFYAKITAISDVYDAMVSKRCYKDPVSPFDVMQMLSLNKFSDLSYNLVSLFLDVISMLLIRKPVILSDGNIGVVAYIRKDNYQYPVVKVDDELIITNENCKITELYTPNIKTKH